MTEPKTIHNARGVTGLQLAGRKRIPSWRVEALGTTFWVVPTLMIVVAGVLFALTFEIDWAADHRHLSLPWRVRTGSADAGRQVLIAIAAAIITTVGVVFSITILALTLASQQFGPRMMRNFIRDPGNQLTLGIFVGTFVYSVLALGSISTLPGGDFVPHLTITRGRSPPAGRPGGAHLLHPSHRQVHSAPGSDRRHRPISTGQSMPSSPTAGRRTRSIPKAPRPRSPICSRS